MCIEEIVWVVSWAPPHASIWGNTGSLHRGSLSSTQQIKGAETGFLIVFMIDYSKLAYSYGYTAYGNQIENYATQFFRYFFFNRKTQKQKTKTYPKTTTKEHLIDQTLNNL